MKKLRTVNETCLSADSFTNCTRPRMPAAIIHWHKFYIMRSFFVIPVLLFFYISLNFSCNNQKETEAKANKIFSDTSRWAVIPSLKSSYLPFNSANSKIIFSQKEIFESLKLLVELAEKNRSKGIMEIDNYKIQFFPHEDPGGDKQILVNCFCGGDFENWRAQLVSVRDGGNCFFQVIINLTRRKTSKLFINGSA